MLTYYPITADNSLKILPQVAENADLLFFKKNQIIYTEGSTPIGAYFVKKGRVKISKYGSDGKEQIIRFAVNNEILNYTDMIVHTPYSSSAYALEDTSIYFISRENFWELIKGRCELFENFIQQLSLDLKNAEEKITDLAYKPVRGRVADALLELGVKLSDKEVEYPSVYISRHDLASYVGTAKETVNRMLSEFRDEGLIRTQGVEIKLLDNQGLKKLSLLYD